MVSLARLDMLLAAEEREPYGGRAPLAFRGKVEFERVSFSYGGPAVLHGIDLTVERGERVAVTGPNGAGKSTLAALLLGLYRPERGRVLADGVPFDELDLRALRRQIGVVMQDPLLFPGSIRENIAYGRPDLGDAAIRVAAGRAAATAFIEALPEGYDTQVGDEGVRLSGGQRQRIALARALLSEPALLVLDEPTTHLDEAAIAALIESLEELPTAPTILLVTHDPDVAAHAERIVHLRDGGIVRIEPRATPEPVR
jgi:ATP-binding cassette subfamily B protein